MIITRLIGGLGNQLFQYAMGRALAVRRATNLRLDTSGFGKYRLRTYALDYFAITGTTLTSAEYRQLRLPPPPGRIGRLAGLLSRVYKRPTVPVVAERTFAFDPSVLDAPATCYLVGYWQSPKYFEGIAETIRKEFTVRDPLSGMNLAISKEIANSQAVAVHIRRGDYVTNPDTHSFHGICEPSYYTRAEDYLHSELGTLTLFVFSDDPDWASRNVNFKSATRIVQHNGPERAHEDLRLMTMCQHHIIANSTLSWWGAWLCAHVEKQVVAPRQWFRDPEQRADDLIPANWIRF